MSIQFTIHSWYVLLPLSMLLFALIAFRTLKSKRYTQGQGVLLGTCTIYAMGVLHFVLFPIDINIGEFANQTPWYKTIQWIPLLTMDAKTFLLNVVLFVPFGFGLPLLVASCKSMRQAAYASFYASLAFELIQLLIRIAVGSGRMTDMNDLIANTVGGVLGYWVYRRLAGLKPIGRLSERIRLQQ